VSEVEEYVNISIMALCDASAAVGLLKKIRAFPMHHTTLK
jgi:hypothetical protein